MYSIVNQLYTYTYLMFFTVFSRIVITVCWVGFPIIWKVCLMIMCFMCVCVLSHFSRVQLWALWTCVVTLYPVGPDQAV